MENFKVLEYIDELEELVANSSKTITGKTFINVDDFMEIIQDIRDTLPKEIEDAKWVLTLKEQKMAEAKTEYANIISAAEEEVEILVSKDNITKKAKEQEERIIRDTEEKTNILRLNALEYLDKQMFSLQERMDEINQEYIKEATHRFETAFSEVERAIEAGRDTLSMEAQKVKRDQRNE